jgi:hypothetical protein
VVKAQVELFQHTQALVPLEAVGVEAVCLIQLAVADGLFLLHVTPKQAVQQV